MGRKLGCPLPHPHLGVCHSLTQTCRCKTLPTEGPSESTWPEPRVMAEALKLRRDNVQPRAFQPGPCQPVAGTLVPVVPSQQLLSSLQILSSTRSHANHCLFILLLGWAQSFSQLTANDRREKPSPAHLLCLHFFLRPAEGEFNTTCPGTLEDPHSRNQGSPCSHSQGTVVP